MAIKATGYCSELANTLQAIQISDRQGTLILLDAAAQKAVESILAIQNTGGKIIIVGNGGSAAIASHMQNDLCKAVGIRAMILTEASLLTALTNDHGYEHAFERQIETWAEQGDLLIAISSSGSSRNILAAVAAARQSGCSVLTLSGFDANNPLRALGDLNFYVPHDQYGMVELAHSVLSHLITDAAAAAQAQSMVGGDKQGDADDDLQLKPQAAHHRRGGLRRRRASA